MKTRVLIIDDDEEHRDVLSEALEYYKFKVRTCADGRALKRMLEIFKPDLVLLDYRLPGENGLELCKKINGEFGRPDLPVIMMSAYMTGLEDTTYCNHMLHKPFDLETLINQINGLLAHYSALSR